MKITHTQKGLKLRIKEFKESEIDYLGEYDDLYVQSDTLLPADVFKIFQNMSCNMWT